MTELNLVDSLARDRIAYCFVTTEMVVEASNDLNQDTTAASLIASEPRSELPSKVNSFIVLK